MASVEAVIREKLTGTYQPSRLEIENDSDRHSGHHGSPGTGESHFNVLLISELFDGLSRVERQRHVYATLAEELAGPVHALALTLATSEEATKRGL